MPRHVFTPEEAARGRQQSRHKAAVNGKKGGVASGAAKRMKKTLAQLADVVASHPAPPDARTALTEKGFASDEQTGAAMVVSGVFGKACSGDPQAVQIWEKWTREAAETSTQGSAAALAEAYANFFPNIGQAFDGLAGKALRHQYTHYDLSGGRGSLKSSFVSMLVPILIMGHPDTHALVLRKVGNTIRDSVFAQYVWALDRLGVSGWWESRRTPMELIFRPTGQRILFRGADDPVKIKSIKAPFGYIAVTHFEEKDQFAGREEIRSILQSTMRGGDRFWNFESFNPPISRDNWANRDSLTDRPDRFRHTSTYLDVQERDWLGEPFFAEAELLREINETAYRHEYLGEVTGTGGAVFTNLQLREIPDAEILTFGSFYQGVDWGFFPDPFQWIRCAYDPARLTLYVLDEYRAWRESNRTSYEALAARGVGPWDEIIADSAEPKSIADFKAYGFASIRPAVKGPGSVDYSMKWLQSLRAIVIDPARAPHAAEEFTAYEYERTKDGEILSGYPDRNNHAIDAVRYALERVWRRKGQ